MTYLEMWAKLEITSEIIRLAFIVIFIIIFSIYWLYCFLKGDK